MSHDRDRAARIVAIVPARRGSRRIPDKNLRKLGDRSLIEYTFDAAKGAACLDAVLVTSDDDRVLQLARERYRFMSILRPPQLATDDTAMTAVVAHALDWWTATQNDPELVVLLQPTSPFRTGSDVDAALGTFRASGRESLVSVCPVTQHPAECVTIHDDRIERCLSTGAGTRQEYPPCYFIDGAIYVTTLERFRATGSLFDERSAVHILPRSHSLDIDEPFDLAVANALLRFDARTGENVFQL